MKKTIMATQKVFFLFVALICSAANTYAVTYYFSANGGDDNRSVSQAQSQATPWRSITKLNAIFNQLNSGDSVLFKSGESFYGSISATRSGSNGAPIIIASYGSGTKPKITGFSTLNGWNNAGGNIWETIIDAAPTSINSVLVNGGFRPVGRYPNANTANGGYLTIESTQGNNAITDLQLGANPNWTGGEIVIRKVRWVLDKSTITQHQQNTLNYNSQSGYYPSAGYGYFIQNHPRTLDQNTEWYYQANGKKFGIYNTGGAPAAGSVVASTLESLVNVVNQSNISFSNLNFSGANGNSFYIRSSQNIQIKDCEILFSGHDAVNAQNSNYISVENTLINTTNNVACNLENCNNIILRKNAIDNTGAFAGMGDGDSGGYEGLLLSGNNQLIEGNTIDSSGYIAVTFRGENVVVKNNVISNFSFVKDDGSGIYTWNNPSNPPVYTNRVVTNNIVLNGLGAGAGTPDPENAYANGIYMDDNAGGVEISGNTVANCANHGLYIHNGHDLVIKNNTIYNNAVQINMTEDDIASAPIRNVTLTGNTFVSKLAGQSVAEYKTNGNDISSFGTFDNNYYSRPLFDHLQIGVLHKENGNYIWNPYDLDAWKTIYGKDQNSRKSPFPIAPYKLNGFVGSNLFSNGSFDNNINGLYVNSASNNASASWSNGVMDGGALKIMFSSNNNTSNKATVVIGVGAISAAKKYILKFSLKGTNENDVLDAYLRKSNSPYNDIAPRNYAPISGNRTEHEMLFSPTANEGNASIGIDIPEQGGPVYLDNIQLTEANVTITNPDDSIRFVYNPEAVNRSFTLDNNYADIANNSYSGSINLAPYTSAVLLKKSSNQPPPENVVCSATGNILREQWNNIGGNDVSSVPVQTPPTATSTLTIFESPADVADNYGARIRGYICPPQTGNYTFWIASDDASELWLSADDNPANRAKIAYALSWTNSREWNKFTSQKSGSIYLQAGHRYYIEALQKEGAGGDNLAVAWQLPSGTMEAPIPGARLSPFVVAKTNQTITFPQIGTKTYGDAPFAIDATASSGLPVSFNVVSGPGTVSGNMVTLTSAGTVIIQASQNGNGSYNAASPVTQNVLVNAPPQATNCSATGSILREQWNNIGGNDVNNIPLQNAPESSSQLTIFEAPIDLADNYGARVRGYICPPQTGNYIFWIAADDGSELWLSTDDNPANKTKIAYSLSWTNPREWNKYPSQKSVSIYLEAGHRYYIEALHKEGAGGDNLAVAWQLPNGSVEAPMPGMRLSPFIVNTAPICSGTGNILREQWDNINGHSINSIPLQKSPDRSMQLTIFESPTDYAENYGARIRGYICPPQTGNYTFWIAADDVAELYLSTSDAEVNKVKIASVPAYTGVREWNKYASQKSATIYLQAGQRYYIEALQKEGDGGDNLAVAWQIPDGNMEAPIPGSRLLPYSNNAFNEFNTTSSARSSNESKATSSARVNDVKIPEVEVINANQSGFSVYPNPLKVSATIEINLPDDNGVQLDLYDEKGRKLKNLFTGLLEKNITKKLTLNAEKLSDGVYIIRLATQAKIISKKVIIIR